MERHALQAISRVEMTQDGSKATLHLVTDTAPVFALEVETAELDGLIAQLLAIAVGVGQAKGDAGTPSKGAAATAVPVPTSGMGLMLGPPGHTLLVFRVGCIDLSLQIENSRIAPIGRSIVEHGIRLAAEPTQAQ